MPRAAASSLLTPGPAPGEILVKVRAFSVNGGELAVRAGRLRLLSGRRLPKHVALDFTGEVAAPGTGVTRFTAGDRVWGVLGRTSGFGTAAEYVTVPAERAGRLPDGLDPVDAAALPVATTAITALRDKADCAPANDSSSGARRAASATAPSPNGSWSRRERCTHTSAPSSPSSTCRRPTRGTGAWPPSRGTWRTPAARRDDPGGTACCTTPRGVHGNDPAARG
jgi:hypothetical protein